MLLIIYGHNRNSPELELTNARENSLFENGKIYEVTFDNQMIYVGSTCEELETRLRWHKNNNKSQVYKFRINKPVIKLIVNTPCRDRKELERVEVEYIMDYSKNYSDKLLNKQCNPLCKKKEIEHHFEIEDETKLRVRAGLEKKLKIKEYHNMFNIDTKVRRKGIRTIAKFTNQDKEVAFDKITKKKDEIINKLTVEFD